MTQIIARMEEQLRLLQEKSNYYHLKEVNLLDRVAMVIREKGEIDDQIHDLAITINQMKCSENPKSWFFRSWSR